MSRGFDPIPVPPTPCWHESVFSARTDSIVALSMQGAHIATTRPLPPGTAVFLELGDNAGIDAVTVFADDAGFSVDFVSVDAAAKDVIAAALGLPAAATDAAEAVDAADAVAEAVDAEAVDADAVDAAEAVDVLDAFDAVPVTSVPRADTPTAHGGHLSGTASPLPRTRTDELFAHDAARAGSAPSAPTPIAVDVVEAVEAVETVEAVEVPAVPQPPSAPARIQTSPLAMADVGHDAVSPPPPPPSDDASADADGPSAEQQPLERSTQRMLGAPSADDPVNAPADDQTASPKTVQMFAVDLANVAPTPTPPPTPAATMQMFAVDVTYTPAPTTPTTPTTPTPTPTPASASSAPTMQMFAITVPPAPAAVARPAPEAPAPSSTSTIQMVAVDGAPKPTPPAPPPSNTSTMQMLAVADVAPRPAPTPTPTPTPTPVASTSTMQMFAVDVPPKAASTPPVASTSTMQMFAVDVAPRAAPSSSPQQPRQGLEPPRTTTPTAPIIAAPRDPGASAERVSDVSDVRDVPPPATPAVAWSKALGVDGGPGLFGDDNDSPVSQTQRWPVARAAASTPNADPVSHDDDGTTNRWPAARATLAPQAEPQATPTEATPDSTAVEDGLVLDEEDVEDVDDVDVDVGEEISADDAASLDVATSAEATPVAAATAAPPILNFADDGEDVVLEFTGQRPAHSTLAAAPDVSDVPAPAVAPRALVSRPLPPPDDDGGVIDVDFSEFQDVLGVSTFQSSGAPPTQTPRTTTPEPVSVSLPRTPSTTNQVGPQPKARNPFGGDSDVSRKAMMDTSPSLLNPQVLPSEPWVVPAGTPSFPSPRLLDTDLDPVLRQGGSTSHTPKPMPFVGDSGERQAPGGWTVAPSANALTTPLPSPPPSPPVQTPLVDNQTLPPIRPVTTPPTIAPTIAPASATPPPSTPAPTQAPTATPAADPFASIALSARATPTAPSSGVAVPASPASAAGGASFTPVSPSSEGLPLIISGAVVSEDDDDDIPVIVGGDPTTGS
jgi:hypothetical protein